MRSFQEEQAWTKKVTITDQNGDPVDVLDVLVCPFCQSDRLQWRPDPQYVKVKRSQANLTSQHVTDSLPVVGVVIGGEAV